MTFLSFLLDQQKISQIYTRNKQRKHPAIKLTMSHTSIQGEARDSRCSCLEQQSIPYLDTSLSMKNNKISVDLYKKPTDRNQYLLPSSCHPNQTTQNIPFSLALRIVRVCTETEQRGTRFPELKSFFTKKRVQTWYDQLDNKQS